MRSAHGLPPNGGLAGQPEYGYDCFLHVIVETCETKVQVTSIQKGLHGRRVLNLAIEEFRRWRFHA